MIEVLFDESEAALMKVAIEKGVIEGDKDKVICLALMLDIGDIKQQIDSDYRKNLILNMYTQNSYDNSKEVLKELKEAIDFYMDEQKNLKNI